MDRARTESLVNQTWDASIVPALEDYIRIPNKSPLFDPKWRENGHMDRAVDLIAGWCAEQKIAGLTMEVIRLEDRTPLIFMEIPGDSDDTVLLYGHLDKQPEMVGWSDGLEPWKPVIRGDRLYGRGGADDGYAAFASLTAIRALQEQGIPHARCVVFIEACEESGSYDLPHYVEALSDRIGTPSLIVCLDSGACNYDQLWGTTSLRGLVLGDLEIQILNEGVHSGDASGLVPSSFRILRQLLSRIDDPETGRVVPGFLHVEISEQRRKQAAEMAAVLGDEVWKHFPWAPEARPVTDDPTEMLLNRTWRPALSITGIDGVPGLSDAGNVLRPRTAAKISLRIPPGVSAALATEHLKELLERDPPYGASVTFTSEMGADGWAAPDLSPWLEAATDEASRAFFGKPAMYMGEGGSIPFMGMLGERFPQAQFLITGVLGPGSNAHGPNEFLDIPTGKRLTSCVARILEDHHLRK